MKKRLFWPALCLVLCFSSLCGAEQVMVFAAASTTNAVTDIGAMFDEQGPGTFTPSFASSSTLARQIERGAPADIFISANPRWMDWLAEKHLIEPGMRVDLLGNRLVLIAPLDSPLHQVDMEPGMALEGLLAGGRLAVGDPDHVPAGMYGKQALAALGVWTSLEPRLARTKDVRAALALVARGEAPLGIVYATDAAISGKVKVVGTFPEDTHPAIIYPAAVVAGRSTPAARAFFNDLTRSDAAVVFETYGFTVLP